MMDAGSEPASCTPGGPGITTCGPGGSGTESCCASLEVSGGTFYRTYANDGGGPAAEADQATVSTFRLDRYEVTVGRFRRFVSAAMPTVYGPKGWTPSAASGKHAHLNGGRGLSNGSSPGTYEPGWALSSNGGLELTDAKLTCDPAYATWTAVPAGNENRPINCVNWFESYAFCIWDGGFLPSEAEWEYAAAGGSQQREYPWGAETPGTRDEYAIFGAGYYATCYYPDGGPCGDATNIAPVGTAARGAGAWGQFDLAGNVFEWNLDSAAGYANPCTDCFSMQVPLYYQRLRGGDFGSTVQFLLPAYRGEDPTTTRSYGLGFRCARTP
jgi:formylglycine-generating enzyme required for sulfatase activity